MDNSVKTIRIYNREMDYFCFGNENGRKIVLLPGLSLKSVMGSAQAVALAYAGLAKDYEIYLFGYVKKQPEDYSIKQMADDVYESLRQLGIEHANIMGVSLGGMIGQTIAIKYPDIVESLVLCSTTSTYKNNDASVFENWRKLAKDKDTAALMESFGKKIFTPSFYEKYEDIIISSGQGASELDFNNFIISVDAIMDFDVYDDLEKIVCPVFVLGAGQDQILGKKASLDIAEKLNCQYYIYEEYGHGVYDEASDYRGRIKDFFDNLNKS